jgi:hypothetical protein
MTLLGLGVAVPSSALDLGLGRLLPGAKEPPCPVNGSGPGGAFAVVRDPPVEAPRKTAWQDALGGARAAQPAIQARLVGWPRTALVERAALPGDDRAFLERLARDAWRGLDDLVDREHALPVDNIRIGASTDIADCHIGDYTNITNVGLHLAAVVAARDLGLIDDEGARRRLRQTLATLARLETHQGFFYNYYDTTTLERTSNFLSFIDSAWLSAGLMVVRSAFPDLHQPASRFLDAMDFGFLYDPALGQMSHGYYVNRRQRSRYHYGVFYTEARLGSLIAIGKGDVPWSNWFSMVRTYPASCKGQTLAPLDSRVEEIRGCDVWTGYYDWNGLRYVPSWGGSMFEALMPLLVLDELTHAPRSLGPNARAHVEVQRRWAREKLGYPVWGLSPSSTPDGLDYGEYGARVLGSAGYPGGVVTPHAAALALAVEPSAASVNLRHLAELYDAYGDYGFYDAVDPLTGQVARRYLALDQSMLFLALANHLTGGGVQRWFADDPIARGALPLLGEEAFF